MTKYFCAKPLVVRRYTVTRQTLRFCYLLCIWPGKTFGLKYAFHCFSKKLLHLALPVALAIWKAWRIFSSIGKEVWLHIERQVSCCNVSDLTKGSFGFICSYSQRLRCGRYTAVCGLESQLDSSSTNRSQSLWECKRGTGRAYQKQMSWFEWQEASDKFIQILAGSTHLRTFWWRWWRAAWFNLHSYFPWLSLDVDSDWHCNCNSIFLNFLKWISTECCLTASRPSLGFFEAAKS